jgi:hypothetical protein
MLDQVIAININRIRWITVATMAFATAVTLATPPPPTDLKTYESVTIASQMACSEDQVASYVRGHDGAFRLSVWLDFPLTASYVILFAISGRLELLRGGRGYRGLGWVVVFAVVFAGACKVVSDLGLLNLVNLGEMSCATSIAKWVLLGIAWVAMSFLFWRRRPLWTEFHVALRAAWFFYLVAGLISLCGVLLRHTLLERIGAPLALAVVTQAGFAFSRAEKFRQHLTNTLPNP